MLKTVLPRPPALVGMVVGDVVQAVVEGKVVTVGDEMGGVVSQQLMDLQKRDGQRLAMWKFSLFI